MVKKIPLQNGEFVLVDDEDFDRVNEHIWSVVGTGTENVHIKNRRAGYLNRFILEISDKNLKITKKDGNPFNFQKENLVIKRQLEITRTRKKTNKKTSSKYKGVCFDKSKNKWLSKIKVNGKSYYLGRFEDENEAAKAYNNAVDELLDGDGYKNVIDGDNRVKSYELKKTKQHRSEAKSGFRGVVEGSENSFQAYFYHEKRSLYLGSYTTKEQAAKAYDKKAYELHGDKAILNFPEDYKRS